MLAAWIAEKGMIGIGSTPPFAIGQRALLVRTDDGNILWDCIAYARRRDSDDDRKSRRHRCHRYLEPPFLHDDGGKDACVHGANPPLPRTSNGSCGPIQLSSFGTVRRKHLGTSSLWYGTAVT
jgi:hypothetical protein